MQTAHELFIHELSDILDAERKLVEALGKQAEESSRPDLKKAFESHQAQTEKQVQRLEQAFESIDEEPQETECTGMKGLLEEHDTFVEEEDPSEDLIDIFNVAAASKVEGYEIAAYTSLIRLADQMDHKKASKLLNQNLKEEQQTLKKMESFTKKLKAENLGMEGEEEEEETMEMDEEEGDQSGEEESTSRKSPSRSKSRRGRAA
jgi:ferritin-like metal-binding protein YciE